MKMEIKGIINMYTSNLEKLLLSEIRDFPITNNSEAVQYIENWIQEYGSSYLKNLYPSFNFIDVFFNEYFAIYAPDGWKLHSFMGLSKINLPSESQLIKFITACNKLKNIEPFCFGTPKLYRGAVYLYIGYRICYDTILAKRIKEI